MEKIKEENIKIKYCPDLISKEKIVPILLVEEHLQDQYFMNV